MIINKLNKVCKMKRVYIFFLAILFASIVFGQQKPIIAVYIVPNETDNNEAKTIKQVLEAKLAESFVKSDIFTATERSEAFLSQLRKERDYQQSGNVRDDQITRLARESGAQFLCIADIYEVFGERFVTARLIHTESNNITATTNSSGSIKSMNDLVTIAGEVSNKLIRETPQYKTLQQRREQQPNTGQGVQVYMESIESNFSRPTTILGNRVRSLLTAKGCSFTDNHVQADFRLKIEATTRHIGEEHGFTVCFADVVVSLFDVRKNTNVFQDEFSQKGIQLSLEAAGRKALEDAAPVIVDKISQWIK